LKAVGALARFGERGQEHGDQERNDADDDEELDQGEGAAVVVIVFHPRFPWPVWV
jgi:hypothetical protein